MPASLYEKLMEHPELFEMLLEPSIDNNEIVIAVNDRLGPAYTTTEASVRRARIRLRSEIADPEGLLQVDKPPNFTNEDRQEFHRLLDLKLDLANISPQHLQEMDFRVWEGFMRNNDGEAEKVTLRKIGLKTRAKPLDWVSDVPSLEELALIRDYEPARMMEGSYLPQGILVVALGDLQVGKINIETREIGTEELWKRVRATTAEIVRHIELTSIPQKIVLLHAGDCIEGYNSQGGRLIKMQDMYLTQQVETYQRILEFQVLELQGLCEILDVAVVPGNHDETTREFEVPNDDSWALFAARNAQRYLELAGVENVRWHYPEPGKLALEFDAGIDRPFHIAMVHGHKIAYNSNQLMDWWRRATFGNQPGALSRILISGHFHHYRCENAGDGKTWIQVPAMDGGSQWFANKRGDDTPAGMVTFWLEPQKAYPIQNLMVHSEEQ